MKRPLLPLAMLLFGTSPLAAQNNSPVQADTLLVSGECMLAMEPGQWSALGLTADQVAQVQAIQTDCKTACQATSETGEKDAAAARGALVKHQERVRQLLSKDQYQKWVQWCIEHGGHTEVPR